MKSIELNGKNLNLNVIKSFMQGDCKIAIAKSFQAKINKCRDFIEEKIKSHEPIYGVNTGFGLFANKKIDDKDLLELQKNLILSHAVGVGEPFTVEIARLIMLFRANVLAAGYSGIRLETLEMLVDMINKGVTPVIPRKGSVGASGDLAPLSHIVLTMMGHGDAFYGGDRMPAYEALERAELKPIRLAAKEGLSLVNGTQCMLAMASSALIRAEKLIRHADIAGALSIEGDRGSAKPFDERVHNLRPHPGQIKTAEDILKLIDGSEIIAEHNDCTRVQDPYSFRCIPQVHGVAKETFDYVKNIIEREMNSCTDNPLVFAEDGDIISAGNFHGEPLAVACDFLAIAIAELGSISERRVACMLDPKPDELPTQGLIKNSGLNSGFFMPHVTMAALVSENKTLCHPASIDSIPTWGRQEDHVSMGAWGARKLLKVIGNVETVIAIEMLAACQAIDVQEKKLDPGVGTKAAYDAIRKKIPTLKRDRWLGKDIEEMISLLNEGKTFELV
ncbi:histidine ammonia-lyase [bacterium]|nr:histidine ammonia-lyase [bacterium]